MLGGCNQTVDKPDYFQKLQGDWINSFQSDKEIKQTLVFSFRGNSYCYLNPYSTSRQFSLKADTITIYEEGNRFGDTIQYHFKILRVSEDSLCLQKLPLDIHETYTVIHEGMPDTFKLKKIKPKHQIRIERVGFYSTACFGACPAMHLELDSTGNMLFWGLGHTEIEGLFSGNVSDSVLRQIVKSIHNIPLKSLERDYVLPVVDIPTYGIKLVTSNQEYEIELHGDNNTPVELTILVHDLMELYKRVDLKMDSTIRDKRQLLNFRYRPKPPPPPPASFDLGGG